MRSVPTLPGGTAIPASGCAAILADRAGRVRGANRRALELLERDAGLSVEGGRLRAGDPRETAALRRLIASTGDAGVARMGGFLAVGRATRQHALVVSVTPVPRGARERGKPSAARARVLVLASDPEGAPAMPEPALRLLYGLTRAEARVAARIGRGETIEEIAAACGVRCATVRTQLQQVMLKTGTHRQVDLVRILLLGIGALAPPA